MNNNEEALLEEQGKENVEQAEVSVDDIKGMTEPSGIDIEGWLRMLPRKERRSIMRGASFSNRFKASFNTKK